MVCSFCTIFSSSARELALADTEKNMLAHDFQVWRRQMGLTQEAAAAALGASRRTVIDWEQGTTPISPVVGLATWALLQRRDLTHQLDMLRTGKMRTGQKELVNGVAIDRDTTAETIERLETQLAEQDAAIAEAMRSNRPDAFDIGEAMMSTRGYCVSLRNRHRGPVATIEFPTREEAEAGRLLLAKAIAGAIAITDTRGTTWS
jgi:DNA-binding XRE family transcriptional regulator